MKTMRYAREASMLLTPFQLLFDLAFVDLTFQGAYAIDEERSPQMVDFMLQDNR